nr:unnamed protein product [Callosobruchus analis]
MNKLWDQSRQWIKFTSSPTMCIRIWYNSEIYTIGRHEFQRSQAVLLGDVGYSIASWLILLFISKGA